MGLTVTQSMKIMEMVEQKWTLLEGERFKKMQLAYNLILDRWHADPRVHRFALAYVDATGEEWFTITSSVSYYTHAFGNQWLDNAGRYWPDYLSGVKRGELWDALADAGYTAEARPEHQAFRATPQASMMGVALRTTGKNWSRLSDMFAALVINISLASDTDELLKAVDTFLDSLK